MRRLERLCDAAVRVESFAGSEKEQNPLYKEYHGKHWWTSHIIIVVLLSKCYAFVAHVFIGLFHLVKLPRLNSLASYLPETLDLAFKLRRKKFSIEVSHVTLPPQRGTLQLLSPPSLP